LTERKMKLEPNRGRGGTYVLVFHLRVPVENKLGDFSGRYCYVGSAMGPGGLRARVARHLRQGKPLQWHIDYLTSSEGFRPVSVYATPDVPECRVAQGLSRLFTGHPRFGCSDCKCPTHLFLIDEVPRLEALMRELGFDKLDLSGFSSGHG